MCDAAAASGGGPWTPALAQVPPPGTRRLALRVTTAAERTLRSGHPWLFDGAITAQSKDGAPGDLAVIFDRKDRFLAVGFYDPTAPIRVRILQHDNPATIDAAFFAQRIHAAVARRAALAATADDPVAGTNGYRLIHGENDALPGLVVDRYAETLVLRLDTPAWVPHLATVLPALVDAQPAERVILRMSRSVAAAPAWLHGLEDGMALLGDAPDAPVLFRENGLIFEAEPVHGQKTGFFLDQRENRQRVGELAAGRRVLNVFAYNGGFSLYAARGGDQPRHQRGRVGRGGTQLRAQPAHRHGGRGAPSHTGGRCLCRAGGPAPGRPPLRNGHHRPARVCQTPE